jgi:hypothetical protein
MDWVIENWIWIALAIVIVWLYTKMRGGHEHGGHEHGGHEHGGQEGGGQEGGHGKDDGCCGHCDESQSVETHIGR